MNITKFLNCPSCNSTNEEKILDLGEMPPVNAFVKAVDYDTQESFPLALKYCKDCALTHLDTAVSPKILFSNYLHLSSASPGNVKHLKEVVDVARKRLGINKNTRILEIGSNDGTLLKFMKVFTPKLLGIDPAKNLAPLAMEHGIEMMVSFFDSDIAEKVRIAYGQFDGIIALNVIAHTPTFVSMLNGIEKLLDANGQFMLENAYVVETILKGQFDTIYHEHICNFSLHSLKSVCERVGLVPVHAEIIPTQGVSIRVWCARAKDNPEIHVSVDRILKYEIEKGFTDYTAYAGVSQKVDVFKGALKSWLLRKNDEGRKVVGLGAPARGVVVLNYCEIDSDQLPYVVDDTTLKQGRLIPGRRIGVSSWNTLSQDEVDTFLLLSWNYKEDMLKKLRKYVSKGTVLVPFPVMQEIQI